MKLPNGFTSPQQLRLSGAIEPAEQRAYAKAAATGRRVQVELRDYTGARIFRGHARVIEINDDADTILGLEVVAVLEIPAAVLREMPEPARPRSNGDASYPPMRGISKRDRSERGPR